MTDARGYRGTTARGTDADEVARFSAQAEQWWDESGPLRMLHRLNPVRIGFIRDQAAARFGRDPKALDSLAGLRVLDIGCGGGILAEPLARLGAAVTGIDPSAESIAAAQRHAEAQGLAIDYRATAAEDLAESGAHFDIVLAMEVVEHVPDVRAFVATAAALTVPGGLVVMATISRTFKSFALAIVAAEYMLGWLPRGTHRWDKFVLPDELESAMTAGGLTAASSTGVVYDLPTGTWRLSGDLDVNYMLAASAPAASSLRASRA